MFVKVMVELGQPEYSSKLGLGTKFWPCKPNIPLMVKQKMSIILMTIREINLPPYTLATAMGGKFVIGFLWP